MKKFPLLLLAVMLTAFVYFGAKAARPFSDRVLAPSELPADFTLPPRPKELTVAFALTSRFAPYEKGFWAYRSCEGMTKDGCSYFLNNEAERYFAALDQDTAAIAPEFMGSVKTLGDGVELWRFKMVIHSSGKKTARDMYAVVRNVDGEWLLDRVVLDVEANAEG